MGKAASPLHGCIKEQEWDLAQLCSSNPYPCSQPVSFVLNDRGLSEQFLLLLAPESGSMLGGVGQS